jgi:glycine/D-amino acid oxidase-like deaminating enzyme
MINLSFWEDKQFSLNDAIIIIGSGIVGLSTALALKKENNSINIVVIDRQFPPSGASTKNAGFYCFGSFSEIVSDLKNMSEEQCIDMIRLRWKGGQILKNRICNQIVQTGGFELFNTDTFPIHSDISYVNQLFEKAIGINGYLQIKENNVFPKFDQLMISMPNEGMLNPMLMINTLYMQCLELNVKFLFGKTITEIDQHNSVLSTSEGPITYHKCVICTNGFTRKLLPEIEVYPARNLVMITEPLPKPEWSGVFHFDEGYYYFRNVGNRLLLGGARNLDPQTETTSDFGVNQKIYKHLLEFLHDKILNNNNVKISNTWSGILGVAKDKSPIIKQLNKNLYMGVRLGGMGVAIGSLMGQKLADLILNHNDQ